MGNNKLTLPFYGVRELGPNSCEVQLKCASVAKRALFIYRPNTNARLIIDLLIMQAANIA